MTDATITALFPARDRKKLFAEARAIAIQESFGGEKMYALLKERNPEIDMILNAGIYTGTRLAMTGETAWSEFHAM